MIVRFPVISRSLLDRIRRVSTANTGRSAAFLLLAGVLGAAAPPTAAPLQLHPERTSKSMLGADTRGGQLVAQQDAAGWRVELRNRTVLDGRPLGAVRMRLLTVATGPDADLVVVLVNTSTDCPVGFAVIAISRSGNTAASPLFGSCADLLTIGVDRDALVFTMPDWPGADGPASNKTFRYEWGIVKGPFPP